MKIIRQVQKCWFSQVYMIVGIFSHSLCHRMFCETHFAYIYKKKRKELQIKYS